MATVLIEEDNLVKLAGVIRQKNGTSRNYHPDEMAQAILDLPTDGSSDADETTVEVLNNTITDFEDPNRKVRTVGTYAMYHASNLRSIDLPVCNSVQAYGFCGDTNLTTISIPNCTSVQAHAFDGCSGLVNLGSIRISSIGDYAFAGTTFSAYFTSAGGSVNNYAFHNNTHLREISFGSAVSFYTNCFAGCSNLESVTLSGSTRSTVYSQQSAATLFAGTKVLTTGHIYVPENMIEKYLEDPSWIPVADRITAIPQPEPGPDPDPEQQG